MNNNNISKLSEWNFIDPKMTFYPTVMVQEELRRGSRCDTSVASNFADVFRETSRNPHPCWASSLQLEESFKLMQICMHAERVLSIK